MRVNREVRVRSDPLSSSSSSSFFLLQARKFLHTLHSRMSEILGSSGWASRMDCSGHCNHWQWHQLRCSSYRDCTCKLVQATGFRTLVFLKAGLSEPFSTYETICRIATQFSRCSWNLRTYNLSLLFRLVNILNDCVFSCSHQSDLRDRGPFCSVTCKRLWLPPITYKMSYQAYWSKL